MTMKYASGPLIKMSTQKGIVPTRQISVLGVVPPLSEYHPLRGEAIVRLSEAWQYDDHGKTHI